LGKNGIEKVNHYGNVNDFEKQKLQELHSELESSIKKGVDFATKYNSAK